MLNEDIIIKSDVTFEKTFFIEGESGSPVPSLTTPVTNWDLTNHEAAGCIKVIPKDKNAKVMFECELQSAPSAIIVRITPKGTRQMGDDDADFVYDVMLRDTTNPDNTTILIAEGVAQYRITASRFG